MRTEANILKDLDDPNVVQLNEVIVDNKMNDFILVEELIRVMVRSLGHSQNATNPDQEDEGDSGLPRDSEGRVLPALEGDRPRRPQGE